MVPRRDDRASPTSSTTTVAALDERFEELKAAARDRLGTIVQSGAIIRRSLQGLFAVEWDFPSVEPPSYLAELNPALYEEECRRVAARFDEALALGRRSVLDRARRSSSPI